MYLKPACARILQLSTRKARGTPPTSIDALMPGSTIIQRLDFDAVPVTVTGFDDAAMNAVRTLTSLLFDSSSSLGTILL